MEMKGRKKEVEQGKDRRAKQRRHMRIWMIDTCGMRNGGTD